MKKVAIDFKYLTPNLISKIKEAYPKGFANNDVITFSDTNNESHEMIKLILDDTLFLVKRTAMDDASDQFDDDYFSSLDRADEICDAESCD